MGSERSKSGITPTLAYLQRQYGGWCWITCMRQGCHHSEPIALAPFVIR